MEKSSATPELLEILILAPTGRDSELIASTIEQDLAASEVRPRVVAALRELCAHVEKSSSAAILLAEEALTREGIGELNRALEAQEPWSDLPIILLTTGGQATHSILDIKQAFSPSGNLTLLERPFRRITLLSAIEVALRARRKQHEVRSLLERQVEATRLRDEFISIASHELKTPLTSLKLQTQINQRKLERGDVGFLEPTRVRQLVDSTSRQVDRLAKLVEDMLDISRINTGKLILDTRSCDLVEMVRETIERIEPQLEAAGCAIALDAPPMLIGRWDRYRIEQVVNNLLTNAMRYCPGRPIHVSISASGSRGRITVRDEGDGIAPEDRERIFSRFERAVTASNISGLGLGLYICRKIVEAHGGSIHVESEPKRGSSFIVELPLQARATESASASA